MKRKEKQSGSSSRTKKEAPNTPSPVAQEKIEEGPQVNYEPTQLGCADEATLNKLYTEVLRDWEIDIHRHKFTDLQDWLTLTLYYLKEGLSQEEIGLEHDCRGSTIGKIVHQTIEEIHPHWTKMVHKKAISKLRDTNHVSFRSHQYVVFQFGHHKAAKFPLYLSETGGFFGIPRVSPWNSDSNGNLNSTSALHDLQSGDVVFLQNGFNLQMDDLSELRLKGVSIFHERTIEGDTPCLTSEGFLTVRDIVSQFYQQLKTYKLFQTNHFNSDFESEKMTSFLAVVSALITYYEMLSKKIPTPLHPVEWIKYKLHDFQDQLQLLSEQVHQPREEEHEQQESDTGDIEYLKPEPMQALPPRHKREKRVSVEGHLKPIKIFKIHNRRHHFHPSKRTREFHEAFENERMFL